jgi:hypothetical protein
VGVVATDEDKLQRAGQAQIVDILALAAHEARIFYALPLRPDLPIMDCLHPVLQGVTRVPAG